MIMNIPKVKLKIAAAQVRDSILASIDADPSVRFSGGFEISMEQTIKAAKYSGMSPCMASACRIPTAAEEL